jgi:hypothetical protein
VCFRVCLFDNDCKDHVSSPQTHCFDSFECYHKFHSFDAHPDLYWVRNSKNSHQPGSVTVLYFQEYSSNSFSVHVWNSLFWTPTRVHDYGFVHIGLSVYHQFVLDHLLWFNTHLSICKVGP